MQKRGKMHMKTFRVIYEVLKDFENAMDSERLTIDHFTVNPLEVSPNKLYNVLEMLNEAGYIEGLSCKYDPQTGWDITANNPRITLKGLEYLVENDLMKIAAALERRT